MLILCVFVLAAGAAGGASEGPRLDVLPEILHLRSIQLLAAGDKQCTTNEDCDIRNSTCQQGVCGCASGLVITSDMTRCLPVALGYGAPCEDSVQCSARLYNGGTCGKNNTCQCADGYHYQKGMCWMSSGLGERCSRNERCYSNNDGEALVCVKNTCRCAPGFYQREYSSCRRNSSAPGEECGINVDCAFKGSVCEKNVCACPKNTTFDQNAKACVAKGYSADATMGGEDFFLNWDIFEYEHLPVDLRQAPSEKKEGSDKPCKTNSECSGVKHSTCIGGSCVCDRGYFSLKGACTPEILQTCVSIEECRVPETICRDSGDGKVCSCKAGFVASQDRRTCRKASRFIKWSCLHPEQCFYFGPAAECIKKKCACNERSHWENEKQYCWKSVAIGGNCSNTEDCRGLKSGNDSVNCVAGLCSCSKGYHSSSDKMACRKDAEKIGDSCEENEDCLFANSACTEKKCVCAQGYFESDHSCVSGIGGKCSSDADCKLVSSTSCVDNKCQCQEGFVPANSTKACLKEVHDYEGVCEDTVQCASTASICKGAKCVCSDNTHFRDGQCRVKKALGSSCSRSSECFLEHDSERTECRNGFCRCKYDFYNPLKQDCTVNNAGQSIFVAIGSLVFWTILTRYV